MSNTAPEGAAATGLVGRLYDLATGEDEARLCRDIPDSQCREEPRGFVAQIVAQALSKTVSKGRRGRVGGYAGTVSGLVAGAVGLYLVLSPAAARPEGLFYALSVSPDLADSRFFFAVLLFILGISHAGVRIGRKTHIVDMAGPDRKAEYVALSNTLIGVLLLVIGAAVGVLMSIGLKFALIVLSVLALLGAATTLAMKNVQE